MRALPMLRDPDDKGPEIQKLAEGVERARQGAELWKTRVAQIKAEADRWVLNRMNLARVHLERQEWCVIPQAAVM